MRRKRGRESIDRVSLTINRMYNPKGKGVLIDPQMDGFDAVFARTQELLQSAQLIFEAGYCCDSVRRTR
jgi:hypothetical protein